MARINPAQIKALRTAASKVFSDDDSYRDWLASNFLGVTSTKDLDSDEASKAIEMLRKACGYRSNLNRTSPPRNPALRLDP